MGLLLSVLITCVGVLEVIACYTRFRIGVSYHQCKSDVTDIARNYAWELRRNHLHHLFPDGEPEEEFSKRIEAHRSRSRASTRLDRHVKISFAENETSDHEEDSTYDQISEIEDISKQIDLDIESKDAENEILELDAEDSKQTVTEYLEVTESKIQNEETPKPDTNDSTFISEYLEKAIQEMCSGKSETEVIENIILNDTTISNFIEKENEPKLLKMEEPQENLGTQLKIDTRIIEDDADKKLILETIPTQPKIDELLNQEPQILEIQKPSINEEISNGDQKEEPKGVEIINDIEDKPINYTQQLLDQQIEVIRIAENGRMFSDATDISNSKLEPKISEEHDESKDNQPTVKSYKDALLSKTEENSSLVSESVKTDDNDIPKELASVLADIEAQIITETPKEVIEVFAKKETKTKTDKVTPANEPEIKKDKEINLETLIREIEKDAAPQEVLEEICTQKKIIHGMADASKNKDNKEVDKYETVNKEPVIEEVCIKQIKTEASIENTGLATKEVTTDVCEMKKDVNETVVREMKEPCVEEEACIKLIKTEVSLKNTELATKEGTTDDSKMEKDLSGTAVSDVKEPCVEEVCIKQMKTEASLENTELVNKEVTTNVGDMKKDVSETVVSEIKEPCVEEVCIKQIKTEASLENTELATKEITTDAIEMQEDVSETALGDIKEPCVEEEICIKQIKTEASLENTELATKGVTTDVSEIKKDVSETAVSDIKEPYVEEKICKENDVTKTEIEKDIITDETEIKKDDIVEIKEPCITEEICLKMDVGNIEKVGTDNEMNSSINSKEELIARINENRSLSPLPENKISDSTTHTIIPESLKAHPEFTTPEILTETGILPEDIAKSSSAVDLECEELLKNSTGLQADDSQATQRVPSPYPMSLFGITTDNGISDLVVNEEFLRSLDGVKPSRCDDRRRSFKKKRNSSSSSRASRDRSATSVEDLDLKSDADVGEKSLVSVEETKSNEGNTSPEENTVAEVSQKVSVDKTKVRNVKEIRKKKFKKAAVSSFEEASSSQNEEVNRRELEKANDNEKRPVSLPSTDAFWVNE